MSRFASIVIATLCLLALTECSETTEPTGTDVKVHFMDFKRADFINQLPKLRDTLSSLFVAYCSSKGSECTFQGNATGECFGFTGETEKEKFNEDNRYVITKLHFKCSDSEGTEFTLTKPLLEEFLTKNRNEIAKNSEVEIAFIEEKLVYPQRNNLDNYIIISVSCVFCVVLIVFNFICQRKKENELVENLANKKDIYTGDGDHEDASAEKFPLANDDEAYPNGVRQTTV